MCSFRLRPNVITFATFLSVETITFQYIQSFQSGFNAVALFVLYFLNIGAYYFSFSLWACVRNELIALFMLFLLLLLYLFAIVIEIIVISGDNESTKKMKQHLNKIWPIYVCVLVLRSKIYLIYWSWFR